MNKKVLCVFTAFTIVAVLLIGMVIYALVFEVSANIMLLGVLALLSEFCGVLALWVGLLRERETSNDI